MSIQEKSKENSSKILKSEDKNLETEIQDSQKNPAKQSDSKETVKSLVKYFSESKINQPELGMYMMNTRSAKVPSHAINKNKVTVKKHSQQESPKNKLCQEKKQRNSLPLRSQRLLQLTEVSSGEIQAVKQSLPPTKKEHCSNTQSKSNKVKTSKTCEKKSTNSKEDENLVINEIMNSPQGKKHKVEHQMTYTCGSWCIQGSEKYLQKTTRKEEIKPVPVTLPEIKTSEMAISDLKKSEMKSVIQVNPNAKSPNVPSHQCLIGEHRGGSILQLGEEITGENESDTVKVKKEASQTQSVKEEKPAAVNLEETNVQGQMLIRRKQSGGHCDRLLPSRKTKPVKCVLNGINSSAKKNHWTKMKLSKVNSLQQNKLDFQVCPKLCLLQTRFSSPALERHIPEGTFLGVKPCDREKMKERNSEAVQIKDLTVEINKTTERAPKNCHSGNQIKSSPDSLDNQMKHSFESVSDKNFTLCLESKLEKIQLVEGALVLSTPLSQAKIRMVDFQVELPPCSITGRHCWSTSNAHLEITIPKGLKLKEAEKGDEKQLIIDSGQKHFGAISWNACGRLYTASNPEDETQHLLLPNRFVSAKICGLEKRVLAEYSDSRIIIVFAEDPKYALKKVDKIRELVGDYLGFQQAPLMCYFRTKTRQKVLGCLLAEHIQRGYRVRDQKLPVIRSKEEKLRFKQKAWCDSTLPDPAICGVSQIWVFSVMLQKRLTSPVIECLR
uniref:Uncharacterized protein n=1 Tax=Otolemur garnettii TaxID=30611 RepID=H0XT29_OTOGA